ncbi:hypothetical protein NBRC116587_37110 [Pseudoteredinibacter isoporae]
MLCATALVSTSVNAQLFDSLKKKAEAAISKTKGSDVTKAKNSPIPSKKPDLGDGPSENLRSFTQCAGLEISNVMVGVVGDYTFKNGFNNEERSGFIKRRKGAVQHGCVLPSIYSREVIHMEVDSKQLQSLGSSWEMQCVKSADPGAGALGDKEPKSEYPYKADYLSGKDVMLHCGHGQENVEACAKGSNSERSTANAERLKKRGKTMLSVHGNTSTLAPANGEKVYCQYYNSDSGKSLFAFEYLRTRN